jgi:hypothetical protein
MSTNIEPDPEHNCGKAHGRHRTHRHAHAHGQPWGEWPCCPQCGTARQCICPICETAGTDFPLADYQKTAAPQIPIIPAVPSDPGAAVDPDAMPPAICEPTLPEPPLLRCAICDEIFRPVFYEMCHACDHRFEPCESAGPPAMDGIPSRIAAAVILLLLTVFGVFFYFWLLLHG